MQSEATTQQLRGAVTRATESLNALAQGWAATNSENAQCTRPHLSILSSTALDFKSTSHQQVASYEDNIEKCLDLLERLERAEQLALKIKSLRGTVDRIAHRLDKRSTAT